MKQISRRGFVKATGALAAAPALASLATTTAGAQNTSDLRVDSNIVFGKGGDIDLLLDVHHPPAGVTPKRMAIIHLFGGGFTSGSKNAGYIVNDAAGARTPGLHEYLRELSVASSGPVAGANP
jgi:hypothetical protein